ncbi:C2 domain-containing protein, partial [Schizophyllum fasciatum]
MSKEERIGTLIVVVLKAKNLIDRHSFYKQDVFCQISMNGTDKRTQVDVKGGQHPVWDDELRFPVMKNAADKFRKLQVTCFAKESKSDDSLGSGTLDVSETLKTGEFDDWIPLKLNDTQRGEVYLEMTYYADGPAPANYNNMQRRPSKLKPNDRLARPPVTPPKNSPLRNNVPLPDPSRPSGSHLMPPNVAPGGRPRANSASSSRHGDTAALPPLGAGRGVPSALQPGASAVPGGHVPSILR